jgi:import inner membrane translocase subunit TIM13
MDGIKNSPVFGGSSSDPKAAVMNQVRQEAALQNAKQLIEVIPAL